MLNLFDIFDPSTMGLPLNWLSTFLGLIVIPQLYWVLNSRFIFLLFNLIQSLTNEFKMTMKFKFNFNNLIFLSVLFFYIMFNNMLGLLPYIFTSSSHLVYSLVFSFSIWMGLMLFGWLKNFNFMMAHLVPVGTPYFLTSFMVLIELTSNLIRPMTLCIRLTANMMAGHLIMVLLGNLITNFMFMYFILVIIQLMLLMLELSVSVIQAYVFAMLMTLYLKETN
uniref:ATP synthase subunit a n=1 Tax=Histeromerus sp. QL-2013 TaxID=1421637 RepID=A0A0A6ZKR2_9HYME|nr:ATP synthase F0 subunit 6 [Histeromerus sp. QL-2013]